MPNGLCECGCGQPTPVASCTDHRYRWVKGQPKPFVNRHHAKNGPLSPAAVAYLAAFDAYLAAGAHRRDDKPVADLKQEALEHLLTDSRAARPRGE